MYNNVYHYNVSYLNEYRVSNLNSLNPYSYRRTENSHQRENVISYKII